VAVVITHSGKSFDHAYVVDERQTILHFVVIKCVITSSDV